MSTELTSINDTGAFESLKMAHDFDILFGREVKLTKQICEMTGAIYPGDDFIKQTLQEAESECGGPNEHDRFVPTGLTRQPLFAACQAAGLKLISSYLVSTDGIGEAIPTNSGMINQNLTTMMVPTDLAGRPFNLSMDEQEEWSRKQGGDGLTSVEEALFLILRKALEFRQTPWLAGWCRCRNSFGSGGSLYIRWVIDDGLDTGWDGRGYCDWFAGALARKFWALKT